MSENMTTDVNDKLLVDARQIIDTARANAVRSVDFNRVMMYWNLGKRIFEEEQLLAGVRKATEEFEANSLLASDEM